MTDQLKLPRIIPGLGENLDTILWRGYVARVRCQLCGCEVGARVVASIQGGSPDTMSMTDLSFWLAHFASQHPGVAVEAEL